MRFVDALPWPGGTHGVGSAVVGAVDGAELSVLALELEESLSLSSASVSELASLSLDSSSDWDDSLVLSLDVVLVSVAELVVSSVDGCCALCSPSELLVAWVSWSLSESSDSVLSDSVLSDSVLSDSVLVSEDDSLELESSSELELTSESELSVDSVSEELVSDAAPPVVTV